MNEFYYIAYGSNTNLQQMHYRCPAATVVGVGILKNKELAFCGFNPLNAYATVLNKRNSTVPVVVWRITKECEAALDRYEGYPRVYRKEKATVYMNDRTKFKGMLYIMNCTTIGIPSHTYFKIIQEGYFQNGIDLDILEKAYLNSLNNLFQRGERKRK
jgi:gamma-glutamylcyclotransferase (GGCT)/AIG2-like uncharacterized protein YtfP